MPYSEKKREYNLHYSKTNRDKINKRQRLYRLKNKDKTKEYNLKYKERTKKWYIDNNIILKEKQRQYKINNRSAISNRHKKYHKNNMSSFRNSMLKKSYGITLEDYNKMFLLQKGCCKICNRHQSEFKRALAVDHNHETKKIRGLLCPSCNTGIGHLQDSIDILKKAIEYLEQNN